MAKIASGVLLLRHANASGWAPEVDQGFQAWIKQYIVWLTTNSLGLGEKAATKYVSFVGLNGNVGLKQTLIAVTMDRSTTTSSPRSRSL